MNIKSILNGIFIKKYVNFNEKTEKINIKQIKTDTNDKNLKNSLFVCINGYNFDSHDLSRSLEKKGIKFIVCEKEIETNLPYVIVENSREVLGALCDNFYNHPTKSFSLIGVIGTNGKTSTTYFIKQLLNLNNKKCSVIGTSGVYINEKKLKETLTTPDPLVLYDLFCKAKKAKSGFVVMEISAHAIYLKKVASLICDIVVFTNFSQDHLDFFKTMECYKQTKFSFFNEFNAKKAIINIDCEAGRELYKQIENKIDTKTYSLERKADYIFNIKNQFLDKTIFLSNLDGFFSDFTVFVPTIFNLYNILCATSVVKELGLKIDQNILLKLKSVKGRFDLIKTKNDNIVIIDYAHTPESLENVLKSVKTLCKRPIIALFGCPGNRDETKREIMGEIAYKYCKKIYITSDNPKYENPLIICDEIKRGAKEKGEIIENRREAIKNAIKNLKKDDVLCVLGKGSEEYQDINNKKIKYSDYTVTLKCIKKLKKQ